MPTRDINFEVEYLISNLNLSREEAHKVLGLLPPGAEPLVNTDLDKLQSMFPEIKLETIKQVLKENNFDQSLEILLNINALPIEQPLKQNPKRKQKQKLVSKQAKRITQNEETDIEVLQRVLNIDSLKAREVYYLNNLDLSLAIKSQIPHTPLTIKPLKPKQQNTRMQPKLLNLTSNKPTLQLENEINELKQRIHTLTETRQNYAKQSRFTELSLEISNLKGQLKDCELDLLAKRRVAKNNYVVDLHGHTLEESKVITEEALRVMEMNGYKSIEIVSGVGRHSNGLSVLREWLRSYLRKSGLKVSEGEGVFYVQSRIK